MGPVGDQKEVRDCDCVYEGRSCDTRKPSEG